MNIDKLPYNLSRKPTKVKKGNHFLDLCVESFFTLPLGKNHFIQDNVRHFSEWYAELHFMKQCIQIAFLNIIIF